MEGGKKIMVRQQLSVTIYRPAGEAYAFLSVPENFGKWASGLGGALRQVGSAWVAQSAEGPVRVCFTEPNAFGVLDHKVILPQGRSVYVPLRVVEKERGCELVLTLFRQPEMSEEKFAADAQWVMRDLQTAKRILEQQVEKENAMSANSAPGYKKHPEHRIETKPAGARVQVRFKGELIADSGDALAMKEGDYPVVYYFPRKDVKMDRLVRTAHHTYCPFKGQASYFSLAEGPENALWSYETPYDEMSAIREHLAFYPDKVDSITVQESP